MSATIRKATQFTYDSAITSVSLLAVLAIWPLLSLVRALRTSH
ncbi:MAG TPA: hypothetical protein VHW09_15685 [Bryobacteraceae bacterium]|nr:hypothetical protein [Bryobacteraceae bacterium]